MTLPQDHIELLKLILQDICKDKPIPRSNVWQIFIKKSCAEIPCYRFERILSDLIKTEQIPGYQIKAGRTGGIYKKENYQKIQLRCYSGKFVGQLPESKVSKLVSSLKPNTTNQ